MEQLHAFFTNIWSIPLVILFFGGSIFLHELGHYLAARWRGLKINRFSIGFGPRLLGWTDKRGVDWRISLIPFGGYVALPQMVDMGRIEGNEEAIEPESLPQISCFDKVAVAAAGPFFNVLFAFAIALVLWQVGMNESETQTTTTIGYVTPEITLSDDQTIPSPARKGGLQVGDRIISIDNKPMETWEDIHQAILLGSNRNSLGDPLALFQIERDGQIISKEIYPKIVSQNSMSSDGVRLIGINPAHSLLVGNVSRNSPADLAGLQKGDVILTVDQQKIFSQPHFSDLITAKGGPVGLGILRNEQAMSVSLTPQLYYETKPLALIQSDDEIIRIQAKFAKDSPLPKSDPTSIAESLIVHNTSLLASDRMARIGFDDKITAVNEQPIQSLAQLKTIEESGLTSMTINGRTFPLNEPNVVITEPESRLIIGIEIQQKNGIIHRSPFEQIANSFERTFALIKGFLNPQSDIGITHLQSPLGIGRALNTLFQLDIRTGLWLTMFLNINLAMMNLLPIPVLDGGHIVFALLAKLRGKPLPARLIGSLQGSFMIMLFGLMFFTLFRDSIRWKDDARYESEYRQKESLRIVPEPVTKSQES